MEKFVYIISHLRGGGSTQHGEIKKTLRPHASMLYMVILVRNKKDFPNLSSVAVYFNLTFFVVVVKFCRTFRLDVRKWMCLRERATKRGTSGHHVWGLRIWAQFSLLIELSWLSVNSLLFLVLLLHLENWTTPEQNCWKATLFLVECSYMALCDCKIQVCQDLNDKKELHFFGLLLSLAWQNEYWLHEDLNNIMWKQK